MVPTKRTRTASHRSLRIVVTALLALAVSVPAGLGKAADSSEQQTLVEEATQVLHKFAVDPDVVLSGAEPKALFVVPRYGRGAILIGVASGRGVLLTRDEKTGSWSHPAFYSLGSVSVGLQGGGDVTELLIVVRTDRGLSSFYEASFALGGDFSIATGPVGAGAKAEGIMADMYAYARSKGLFAGISLEGAKISILDDWNGAYYGAGTEPEDILVKETVSNPGAASLRQGASILTR